jgi:hypothetical protein
MPAQQPAGEQQSPPGVLGRPVVQLRLSRDAVLPLSWAGASLGSPNGRYRALLQTDGHFVVCSTATGALWSRSTARRGSSRPARRRQPRHLPSWIRDLVPLAPQAGRGFPAMQNDGTSSCDLDQPPLFVTAPATRPGRGVAVRAASVRAASVRGLTRVGQDGLGP